MSVLLSTKSIRLQAANCLLVFIFFAVSAQVQTKPLSAPHLTVALVSEESSLQPGRDFWVGLRFDLEKGWHIYWINPGDSGEPPKVQWKLPVGLQAGPIEWPAPQRIQTPPLTSFGYEHQVLLMALIHQLVGARMQFPATLSASVRWIVCREVCIPGKSEVTLTLPLAQKSVNELLENHTLFASTRARLSQPVPAAWKPSVTSQKDSFVLTVHTGKVPTAAEFFPLEPLQIENAAQQPLQPFAGGFRLSLKKSEQLLKPLAHLKGVLLLPGDKSYVLAAPVSQAQSLPLHHKPQGF